MELPPLASVEAAPGKASLFLAARVAPLRPYLPILGHWLALRLLLIPVAALSLYLIPLPTTPEGLRFHPSLTGYQEVVQWLAAPRGPAFYWVEPLWRWDAVGYVSVARDGYRAGEATSTVFPPLYPMAVRAVQGLLPGQWIVAGLLVSALATAITACLLLKLVRREFGRSADLAPLLLLSFPTAFYLSAPYAESPFLALTLGTLLTARAGHWWWAAALALLASLTKSHGLALVVPLAVLAFQHYRRAGSMEWGAGAALLAPLLAPLGLEVYSRIWLGDLGPLAQQTTRWGWVIVLPGWTIVEAVGQLVTEGPRWLADLLDLPLVVAGLLWLGWGWRRLPPYLFWYGVAVLLPGLSRLMVPPLAANTRFLLLALPIPIAMALWADRPWRRISLVSASLLLQLFLLVAFVHWAWIA